MPLRVALREQYQPVGAYLVSDDVGGSHDGRLHDKRDTEEPESGCGVSDDPLVKVVECGDGLFSVVMRG